MFANHPDLVEEVLVNQNRKFIKHYRLRQAKRTLGNGLLTSEGEFWRGQRKLAQPAFHRERIAAYAGLMVEYTERMLAAWADGQVRDVQADMMRLTLEIVAKTLFDAEVGGESAEASAAMETLMHSFTARTGSLITVPRLDSHARRTSGSSGRCAGSTGSSSTIIAERRAQRRGPGRPALDAPPRPGRGERPADDRPPAPRRGA